MIAYWLFRLCSLIWQRMPLKWGYAIASLIADITFGVWGEKKQNMLANMRVVLGNDADERVVRHTARQSLRNYFKLMVDFLRFPRMKKEDIEKAIRFNGWEDLDHALERGKGVIFIGMHMGSWDVAGAAIALRNYPLNVVVDTFKPERLDQLVQGSRIAKGVKIIPAAHAAKKVLRVLRSNEILALLIDRPSPENGVPVQFFNCTAYVPAGAATLALRTGASVLIGGLVRQPDDSYLGLVDRHIDFEPTGNRERDIQDLTQTIIGSLEKWVRQYPDQWYMFRRMWVKPDRFEPKRQEVQPKEALAQD